MGLVASLPLKKKNKKFAFAKTHRCVCVGLPCTTSFALMIVSGKSPYF